MNKEKEDLWQQTYGNSIGLGKKEEFAAEDANDAVSKYRETPDDKKELLHKTA